MDWSAGPDSNRRAENWRSPYLTTRTTRASIHPNRAELKSTEQGNGGALSVVELREIRFRAIVR